MQRDELSITFCTASTTAAEQKNVPAKKTEQTYVQHPKPKQATLCWYEILDYSGV